MNLAPSLTYELLSAYMAERYLAVAAEAGIFARLARGPATLAQLADASGLPLRTLRILADALAALGALERQGATYCNSPAAEWLGGTRAPDLRPALRLADALLGTLGRQIGPPAWRTIIAPQWAGLARALREDRATFDFATLTPAQQRLHMQGVAALTAPVAARLAQRYPFGHHQRLLDLGGGAGSFALAALRRYPALMATLFDLPAVVALAGEELARGDAGRRTKDEREVPVQASGNGTRTNADERGQTLSNRVHPRLSAFNHPNGEQLQRGLVVRPLSFVNTLGAPLAPRLQLVGGDFFADAIPPAHDAIVLANVLHLLSPARGQALLRRIHAAAPPAARLLLVDFWTDASRTRPVLAALMAGAFQTVSGAGDVYSADEARAWLAAAGWRTLAHTELAHGQSVLIAERA